jgi:hypothetical protein
MSIDFTACAERNRQVWQQARARHISQMTADELAQSMENHPTTANALRKFNADIAAAPLPPVVDKDYVENERAAYDQAHEGDRFE